MFNFKNIDEYIEQSLPSRYDNFASCDPEFDAVDDDLVYEFAAFRQHTQGDSSWA